MIDNKPCLCKNISKDKIEAILRAMPKAEQIERLGELFRIFGDPSRLRIIHILMHQELCVADLSALLNMQQPAVSQQLKLLRLSRLVKNRKEGKTVYYSLDDDHVSKLFKLALLHLQEN
jgi:ArsR family transcriptional regulator, lead/cadmium/zinc/bismuth-responsive transcriptional repressor